MGGAACWERCVCVCLGKQRTSPEAQRWRLAKHTPLWLPFVWPLACSSQTPCFGLLRTSVLFPISRTWIPPDFWNNLSAHSSYSPPIVATWDFLHLLRKKQNKRWFGSVVWHRGAAGTCCTRTSWYPSRRPQTSSQRWLTIRWDVCWLVCERHNKRLWLLLPVGRKIVFEKSILIN